MSLQELPTPQLFRPDCDGWLGYKPCPGQRAQELPNCDGCVRFSPAEATTDITSEPYDPAMLGTASEVGIVEMGGLGSVLRTSAVSRAIQDANPRANITWFTHTRGAELLRYVPGVIAVDVEAADPNSAGPVEGLDVLINFELNAEAKALTARARSVACFALNTCGRFEPASVDAESFQRFQVDDPYREANNQNMQQILLASVGLENTDPRYDLALSEQTRANAKQVLEEAFEGKLPEQLIGLNIGTSEKGLLKRWSPRSFADLARKLADIYPDAGIVMLSGPEDETPRAGLNAALAENIPQNVKMLPHDLEVGDFMGVVGSMNAVVTGDTFAMHAARAQDVPVVVLAGPMPHKELEVLPSDSVIGPKLGCSPCYYRCARQIIGECMELISVDEVAESVAQVLATSEIV